jgi:hypothetical protein
MQETRERYVKRTKWCNPWAPNIHAKQEIFYTAAIKEHPTKAPNRPQNFNAPPVQQTDSGIGKPILTYLRSWSLPEKLPIVQPFKNFPAFYETLTLSSCSQEPSTGPYPEPVRSSPHHPILSLWYILILYTHLRLGLPSGGQAHSPKNYK